jgi:hypothetical protein
MRLLNSYDIDVTNRGERVVQLIPTPKPLPAGRGRGFLKDKIHFYPGWDSPEEDKKIEEMFEPLDAFSGD